MTTEVDDFLSHHGVLGMKWGKHKAVVPGRLTLSTNKKPKGFFNKPNAAKAVLLGSYGRKSSYTNASALSKRKSAGKLRAIAIIGGAGANVIGNLGSNQAGLKAVSAILGTAASGVQVASIIQGAVGAHEEAKSRKS